MPPDLVGVNLSSAEQTGQLTIARGSHRKTMQMSLINYPDDSAAEGLDMVKTCETLELHAYYLTDSNLRYNSRVLLGTAAHKTTRIRPGPNAVHAFTSVL